MSIGITNMKLNCNLVTKGGKFCLDRFSRSTGGDLFASLKECDLALVECLGLDFALSFKSVDDIFVAPTILMTESLDGAPFASRLQP